RDHLVHERFGGQTSDARQRAALMQSMGDRQQKMGLAEPRATVDEERVEASARLVDHGARTAPRHLVAPPYDEGLKRTSRRRRRAAPDGRRLGSPRRPSRRRPRLERPVHDESESCSGTCYAFDRLCECVQMVLPNPLEAEGARDLNGELPGLEAGRPQRGDPGVEIFREQASTELPSHLPPDGVEHPPTPRCAAPGWFCARAPARFCPQGGRGRRPPRGTSRSQLRPPPTPIRHTAAPIAGATASNPSLVSCSRKQYVAGG